MDKVEAIVASFDEKGLYYCSTVLYVHIPPTLMMMLMLINCFSVVS